MSNLLETKARLLLDHGKILRDHEINRWDVCSRQITVLWHEHEYEICIGDGYVYDIIKY